MFMALQFVRTFFDEYTTWYYYKRHGCSLKCFIGKVLGVFCSLLKGVGI